MSWCSAAACRLADCVSRSTRVCVLRERKRKKRSIPVHRQLSCAQLSRAICAREINKLIKIEGKFSSGETKSRNRKRRKPDVFLFLEKERGESHLCELIVFPTLFTHMSTYII